jgi:3-hydroxybutyryl-CoA dehydrogenase
MKVETIKNISVLGAGIMGHGIAQAFLMGGYSVKLYDLQDSILDTARSHIQEGLRLFHDASLIKKRDIRPALEALTLTTDLRKAVKGADFVVEAAPENLSLKQELFAKLEPMVRKNTIIASNTSSLTLAGIGEKVKNNKGRLVITHWFNPPHIVPTVEVVKGKYTTDATADVAVALLKRIRKVPVKINEDIPGFLVNRIQMAMIREVWDLHERGVASAEDIDKAIKGSVGFRLASIGPLLTADLGGLDLWLKVYENLAPKIRSAKTTPQGVKRLVSQGHHGIKSGKGFYDYAVDFSKGELDETVRKRDREFLKRLKDLYWND